jgi:hypothetical protein
MSPSAFGVDAADVTRGVEGRNMPNATHVDGAGRTVETVPEVARSVARPIPTRLPAGLTESELMTGYQRCATGCSAAPFVSVNGEAICERCAAAMGVKS